MRLLATIGIALAALRLNALRTGLAMLGIIIGVASVIAMASVSAGASKVVEDQINALGSTLLLIRPGSGGFGGRHRGAGTAAPLTERDVVALRDKVPGLAAISGSIGVAAPVVAGNQNWTTTVSGVHADFLEARNWLISEGRGFDEVETRSKAKVAIIGRTIAEKLFEGASPLHQRFRVRNIPFEVIGVLKAKGQSSFGSDQDDLVLVPITTARARLLGQAGSVADRAGTIFATVQPGLDMDYIQAEIEDVLRQRRRIQPGEADDFTVANISEFIQTRNETQQTLGLLLAATALISLMVGGIGIMNIMLVSVTERTREIGLRMAVGARESDILTQFLIEAITLCLIGGIVGLGIGVAGSAAFARFGNWPILIDLRFALAAILGSAMIGVFFGFYPARRASRLNPIDALRFE